MSPSDPGRLMEVLDEVLRRLEEEPGSSAEQILQQLGCAPDLAAEALGLLRRESGLSGFMAAPAVDGLPERLKPDLLIQETASLLLAQERASLVGPYQLLDTLGEGGMGRVYRARHGGSPDREVALKLLRHRFRGPRAYRQFELERRALEQLDHPHIARLFDAGKTDDERPYVVMEYIDGMPLHRFCDARRLSIDRRVQMVIQLCHAVHHAHTRRFLHLDLKPSNVLVSADGEPKIIDFGLARALDAAPDDRDDEVQPLGRRLGTPTYMSPEALRPNAELDGRADLYSLAVLLYELTAGLKPFPPDATTDPEVLLRTRRKPVPAPAIRYRRLPKAKVRRVAERRDTTPDALEARLDGPLAGVLQRALAYEPDDRPADVAALARDLERAL